MLRTNVWDGFSILASGPSQHEHRPRDTRPLHTYKIPSLVCRVELLKASISGVPSSWSEGAIPIGGGYATIDEEITAGDSAFGPEARGVSNGLGNGAKVGLTKLKPS